MGRRGHTDQQAATRPPFIADISTRLQQIVAGWQGAERNQPLSDLHNECLNATGPGGRHLLPVRLLLVKDLDETHLQATLKGLNGKARVTQLLFRVKPLGRFDSVLVPAGPPGEAPTNWLLAIEENLSLRDQVALYGHALGHLLLNNDQVKMDRLPDLDPKAGYAHSDMLAELRMLETIRHSLDRRVLETYPPLTNLLGVQDEPPSVLSLIADDLHRRLAQFGWRRQFIEAPYIFTNGRVSIRGTGNSTQHGKRLRIDALLRAEASLPIAVVQTIHAGETREDVIRRLTEYAHHRLAVPFAYLFDDDGTIYEFDWTANEIPAQAVLTELPTRETLWNRWAKALGLTDKLAKDALQYPYQLSGSRPRYYQEAAINRAVIAVLQAKRNLRQPRILLTLATGTGKTKIAFQLVWKLKRSRAIRNILYLTDRDWLLSQAMDNEFAQFSDARQRILGEAKTSRDIVFATYQAIADNDTRSGLYRDFPRDFFDVIIVDECHRGSAQDNSRWRSILEYFTSAVQVGMTATPLSTDAVQTDDYFGKSIYTYSLRTGINDGFLAPYRVRHILMASHSVGAGAESGGVGDFMSAHRGGGDRKEKDNEVHPSISQADRRGRFIAPTANVSATSPQSPTSTDNTDRRGRFIAPSADLSARAPQSPTSTDLRDEEDLIFSTNPIIAETAATLLARTEAIAQHLAAYLRQTNPLAKTIVFCVDQQHAEQMREALERACAEYVMRYRGYIERIVSDEGAEGKRALGRFSTPEERTPVIVTTSRLLSTGVDVPTCKNIVLARPVGSLVEFKQIIGRGSRLYEPDKTWFTIIDYAGAIKLFFDPNFDGDPELVEVESLVPQPRPQPEEDIVGIDTDKTPAQNIPTPPTDIPGTSSPPLIREESTDYPPDQQTALPVPPAPSLSDTSREEPDDYTPFQAVHSKGGSGVDEGWGPLGPTEILDLAFSQKAPGSEPPVPADEPAIPTPPAPPEPGSVTEPPLVVKQTRSGQTIQVIGEYVYDLAPDGKTLIPHSSYREYTAAALKDFVKTPTDLRTRWLNKDQREALRDQLTEEGVDLQALARALKHPDVDPLDLLLNVAFGQSMLTRGERVERLYREHADFFNRYKAQGLETLKVILEKYIAGIAEDVSDTGLLKVFPLSKRGTFSELAQPFGGSSKVRGVLKELQSLLYSA